MEEGNLTETFKYAIVREYIESRNKVYDEGVIKMLSQRYSLSADYIKRILKEYGLEQPNTERN